MFWLSTYLSKMVQFVIVVDDENEEIEGNLVMAASHVTPEAVAFIVKNGSGIVSVGMKDDDLERLKLPLMSPENEDDSSAPSFTITVVIYANSFCTFIPYSYLHSNFCCRICK